VFYCSVGIVVRINSKMTELLEHVAHAISNCYATVNRLPLLLPHEGI